MARTASLTSRTLRGSIGAEVSSYVSVRVSYHESAVCGDTFELAEVTTQVQIFRLCTNIEDLKTKPATIKVY
jgi:hypothetical protein